MLLVSSKAKVQIPGRMVRTVIRASTSEGTNKPIPFRGKCSKYFLVLPIYSQGDVLTSKQSIRARRPDIRFRTRKLVAMVVRQIVGAFLPGNRQALHLQQPRHFSTLLLSQRLQAPTSPHVRGVSVCA